MMESFVENNDECCGENPAPRWGHRLPRVSHTVGLVQPSFLSVCLGRLQAIIECLQNDAVLYYYIHFRNKPTNELKILQGCYVLLFFALYWFPFFIVCCVVKF